MPVCPSKLILDQIKYFGLYHYKAVFPVHHQMCTSCFTQGTATHLLYLNNIIYYCVYCWFVTAV